MDVKPSKLHNKLIGDLIRDRCLSEVVEFHGVDLKDGHTVLLVKVNHDVSGLLRAIAEHAASSVMDA